MRLSFPIAVALLTLGACNTLTPLETQQYENLLAQGAEPVQEKSPTAAAALNLLPGFGDVYTGEWGAFALDFLLWWPSVFWAVPQGALTAQNYNKRATIAYYSIGPGKDLGFDPNGPRTLAPGTQVAP
jgi:hypothetical protein